MNRTNIPERKKSILESVITLSNIILAVQILLCLSQVNKQFSLMKFILLACLIFAHGCRIYRMISILLLVLAYLSSSSMWSFGYKFLEDKLRLPDPERVDEVSHSENIRSESSSSGSHLNESEEYEEGMYPHSNMHNGVHKSIRGEEGNLSGSQPFNPSHSDVSSRMRRRHCRRCPACRRALIM